MECLCMPGLRHIQRCVLILLQKQITATFYVLVTQRIKTAKNKVAIDKASYE